MTIACPECGLLEQIPPLPPRGTAHCRLCDTPLETRNGRSIGAALACSLATLMMLVPTNLLPLMELNMWGIHSRNTIMGGIAGLWQQGWVFLPAISAICLVVLPFVRFALSSAVLAAIKLDRRASWLGPAFRWALWLDSWAMIDVFLLAAFVGYYRLSNVEHATLTIDAGGKCFIAAAFLTMLSRATLDRRTVWRAIAPERDVVAGEPTIGCTTCDVVQPRSREGCPCPRCGARLHARKPGALGFTTAILIAAFLLLFPANLFPMNVSRQLVTVHSYTIFTGIKDLFQAGLWPLGCIIFCTSIFIPFGKIATIGWCVASARFGWTRHVRLQSHLFGTIAELGRWSKTDPYTIVFFVPLMHFGVLASSRAGWGATAFIGMTFLSMVAARTFDPRLMWDRVEHDEADSRSWKDAIAQFLSGTRRWGQDFGFVALAATKVFHFAARSSELDERAKMRRVMTRRTRAFDAQEQRV
ncbi:MAG TPA: paraquat-inducible protein A [Rhizomicrobium sp.]|nr:paraquat-inducible protein A [Rhizomicrobium sp.]